MTETAPTEAGIYDVYADIAAGDNYNAGVIKVGAFTIEKADATLTFSRLSDKSNNIQGAGVAVSPADDSATSKIKVEYKIENEWTTTKPTAVGSYPVRAYMPEGTDNLYAVAVDRASTDTYVIEQYVAPNPPSGGGGGGSTGGGSGASDGGTTGGGAGNSETGDDKNDTNTTEDTTTETKPDGTTVETTTETSDDGTKTETVTETSADGKTSSSIEVKTNANGKVTESVVSVDKEVKGKKLTIDMSAITDMIDKNDNATKKNTTVVLTANDKNGKEKFTVEVDAKNLKAGAELKIYAIDKKGNPVIVDASKNNVTVTKTGDIKLNIAGTGEFTIVTPKEAAKMEKAIEKSVKPAKTQVTVEQGMKATFKLDSGCNKDNIAKIIYKSDNANVKVNKNGKITVKDAANATITATVTLANGKTKTITMKIKGK